MRRLDMSMEPAAVRRRELTRARKMFATAAEQMQTARVHRERRNLKSMRTNVWMARENVRMGRRIRARALAMPKQ